MGGVILSNLSFPTAGITHISVSSHRRATKAVDDLALEPPSHLFLIELICLVTLDLFLCRHFYSTFFCRHYARTLELKKGSDLGDYRGKKSWPTILKVKISELRIGKARLEAITQVPIRCSEADSTDEALICSHASILDQHTRDESSQMRTTQRFA